MCIRILRSVCHSEADDARLLLDKLAIRNVLLQVVTVSEFKSLLKRMLNIDHPMTHTTEAWARKLPEFKMLVAYLFPERLEPRHRFWGYADLDLVWGDLSRYSPWFSGRYSVVKTHEYPHGPAQFFANERRFIE
jgi:hypothetical protein